MTRQADALRERFRRPDLSVLGTAIRSLPPSQWRERMLFAGAPDEDLRQRTGDGFPKTLRKDRKTHPVFVLVEQPSGHLLCPCTTRGNPRKQRFIRKDCRLEMTERLTDKRSFLVEEFVFTIPLDQRFSRSLHFLGRVPVTCLSRWRAQR